VAQQRRRITSGAQGFIGADRPAVDQGNRRIRPGRRHGVGRQNAAAAGGHVDRACRHRFDAQINQRQNLGQRR